MLALQTPDPALALPEGTQLQPQVLMRNTTPQVQAASLSFIWRGDTQKGNVALPPMQLKPFETVLLDVKALQQQGKIPPDAHWALVKISSPTAKPDDIMAIASSYDSTGRYGAQTPFFDQLANHWAAGAFVVDSTHNSLITITNGGTKPADAVVTFHYNNGSKDYEVARTIASGDQAWINMAELIRGQIPDAKGAKFPAELTTGSYDVRQPDGAGYPSLLKNKIIVDKTYGHLAYGCALCCGYTGTSFNPAPFAGAVGAGTLNTILAQDACDQWQDDVTNIWTSWGSDNPPVATVANAYSHLVGVGGAHGSAFVSLPWGARNRCPNHGTTPAEPLSGLSVSVTTVDLPSDKVTVSLSGPSGISGTLSVTWSGPGPNPAIAYLNEGPGTYTFNPNLNGLQPGQYTGVAAQWTVPGGAASGSKNYNFNVLGTWRHSQYNTPTEINCSVPTSPAYTVNSTTCAYSTNNLRAQFISQSWENGSGQSISSYYGYTAEQNAQWCISHGYLPGDATGKSFAFEQRIIPSCGSGYSLNTNTVAWNFSSTQTLNCGDQVLIVGLGAGAGTVKTVTDKCGAGCSNTQLDNYTTVPNCDPHQFVDLGNFTTIRLGR
jgi:hypothetical protein